MTLSVRPDPLCTKSDRSRLSVKPYQCTQSSLCVEDYDDANELRTNMSIRINQLRLKIENWHLLPISFSVFLLCRFSLRWPRNNWHFLCWCETAASTKKNEFNEGEWKEVCMKWVRRWVAGFDKSTDVMRDSWKLRCQWNPEEEKRKRKASMMLQSDTVKNSRPLTQWSVRPLWNGAKNNDCMCQCPPPASNWILQSPSRCSSLLLSLWVGCSDKKRRLIDWNLFRNLNVVFTRTVRRGTSEIERGWGWMRLFCHSICPFHEEL